MAANKFITQASGVLTEVAGQQTSAGPGDANKIVALGSDGLLDITLMPSGVGAATYTIAASQDLAAGDFVNIHDSSGAKVRKADASAIATRAHGYVLAAVTSGQNATVYTDYKNTEVTGKTPGADQYLSETAGAATETAPTGAGVIVQRLGVAASATVIDTEISQPIVLA